MKKRTNKVTEYGKTQNTHIITLRIGEIVDLKDPIQVFTQWWEGIE